MARQLTRIVEDDVALGIEGNAIPRGEFEFAGLAYRGQPIGYRVWIERFGLGSGQAKQNGRIRAVAAPGVGQRSMQRHLDTNHNVLAEAGCEGRGRFHRSHRVGTRWPDTDLEDIEDADASHILVRRKR